MLILRIIIGILLVVPITWVIVFAHLYLLSKTLDWLYAHYGTTIRRLRRLPLKDASDNSSKERGDAEYLIYLHYTSHYASLVFQWICDASHVHIKPRNGNRDAQCNKACPKSLVPWRPFLSLSLTPFPISHIRTIVNWLKRRVNQSGKEPV
jgi:hypothetical protein